MTFIGFMQVFWQGAAIMFTILAILSVIARAKSGKEGLKSGNFARDMMRLGRRPGRSFRTRSVGAYN